MCFSTALKAIESGIFNNVMLSAKKEGYCFVKVQIQNIANIIVNPHAILPQMTIAQIIGQPLCSRVIIGPIFYQHLKHFVRIVHACPYFADVLVLNEMC